MPTLRAVLAGVRGVHSHIPDTSFRGFVFQYVVESGPSLFGHCLRVPAGPQHSRNVEGFYTYPVMVGDQVVGEPKSALRARSVSLHHALARAWRFFTRVRESSSARARAR